VVVASAGGAISALWCVPGPGGGVGLAWWWLLGGEECGQDGGEWDRGDQPHRAAQGPDDLDGHELGGGHRAEGILPGDEQDQQRQRRPA
jgi:hypothetical protein